MCYQDRDYGMYDPCHCCRDHDKTIEALTESVESIVKQLYIDQKIDCARLECNLDNLCYMLGIKVPAGIINLYRHSEKIEKFEPRFSACDLLDETKTYLKALGGR